MFHYLTNFLIQTWPKSAKWQIKLAHIPLTRWKVFLGIQDLVNSSPTLWTAQVQVWKPIKVVESFQPRTCVDPRISQNDVAHSIRYRSKTYSFGVISDEGLPCVNQIELAYIILSQDLPTGLTWLSSLKSIRLKPLDGH